MRINKEFLSAIDKYVNDSSGKTIASEGGPGSGFHGHGGRKGLRGGSSSRKQSFGGGGFSEDAFYRVDDDKNKLINDRNFNAPYNYNNYKNETDTNHRQRFNSNAPVIYNQEDVLHYDNKNKLIEDHKGAFTHVQKMADKDAYLDNIGEQYFYDRIAQIDNLMGDNVEVDGVLGKHYLVKEYTDRMLTSRYNEKMPTEYQFNSEYTPWASAAVKNRDMYADTVQMDVSDKMVKNYIICLTGVTKGYDTLQATGAIEAYDLLSGKPFNISEVKIADGVAKANLGGTCMLATGESFIYASSEFNTVQAFTHGTIHENMHKIHGSSKGAGGKPFEIANDRLFNDSSGNKALQANAKPLDTSSCKNLLDYSGIKYDQYMSDSESRSFVYSMLGGAGRDRKEFMSECFSFYLRPGGVLNPNNLDNEHIVPKSYSKYAKDLSRWIGGVNDIASNNTVKPVKDWET